MENTIEKMSYKQELKTLRENLVNFIPQEELKIFDNNANDMQDSFTNILKLKKGDIAPNFILPNALGNKYNLYENLETENVILVFYRGSWCPYCSLQINQFNRVINYLKENNTNFVAISPMKPDASLSFKEKENLKIEILSDKDCKVAKHFTTVFSNDEKPTEAMQRLGIDFLSFYESKSRFLPVPAVFVINKNREIIFAETEGGDYRNRVEISNVLKSLNL